MKYLTHFLLIVLILMVSVTLVAQESTPEATPPVDSITIPTGELAELIEQFSAASSYERLVIGAVGIALVALVVASVLGVKAANNYPSSAEQWIMQTLAGGALLTQTPTDNRALAILLEQRGFVDLAEQLREQAKLTPQAAANRIYKPASTEDDPLLNPPSQKWLDDVPPKSDDEAVG